MKTVVFLIILLTATVCFAGKATTYLGCGTSGVTYYAYEVNTGYFYNSSTSDFDTGTYGTDTATQVGGASSPVWTSDDLPEGTYGKIFVIFLDSSGSACGAESLGR